MSRSDEDGVWAIKAFGPNDAAHYKPDRTVVFEGVVTVENGAVTESSKNLREHRGRSLDDLRRWLREHHRVNGFDISKTRELS